MSYRNISVSTYYRSRGGNKNGDWRSELAELKDLRQYTAENYGKANELQRDTINEDLRDKKARVREVAVPGVLAEFEAKIGQLEATNDGIRKARANEITRFDPHKVTANMELARQRIQGVLDAGDNVLDGGPTVADKLKEIYEEAQVSEDLNMQRGTFETFKSVLAKVPPDVDQNTRLVANRLSKQANQDLAGLRTTEALEHAMTYRQKAIVDLLETRAEIIEVGQAIGDDPTNIFAAGPLATALKRLQVDGDQVTVLAEDHPDVTGIVWKTEDKNITAGG